MKLSQINGAPSYNIVIPSTKKVTQFRPFLVKEEKALLAAQESEDESVILQTLHEVIKSCLKDNTQKLTSFDLEYIFTHIRSKSVGEQSELIFKCQACNDPKAKTKKQIDLRSVQVVTPEEHTKRIKISDKITVEMKYPTVDELVEIMLSDKKDIHALTLKSCIDKVYHEDEVFNIAEESDEELDGFFDSLSGIQHEKLSGFIESMPYAKIDVDYTCPVCGHEHHKELRGISNFF